MAPTGFTDYTNPSQDEGMIWYTSGANVGQSRKITSVAATVVTVIMPFPNANALGDLFITHPYFAGGTVVTLDTPLLRVRNDATGASGGTLAPLDFELNGTGDSYIQMVQADSVWNAVT